MGGSARQPSVGCSDSSWFTSPFPNTLCSLFQYEKYEKNVKTVRQRIFAMVNYINTVRAKRDSAPSDSRVPLLSPHDLPLLRARKETELKTTVSETNLTHIHIILPFAFPCEIAIKIYTVFSLPLCKMIGIRQELSDSRFLPKYCWNSQVF